jgi:hypothetical protein
LLAILVVAVGTRLGRFGQLLLAQQLLLAPDALLLDLLQQALLVREQVRDARVLLQLAAPFWVFASKLTLFALFLSRAF